jgi:large subunit ribosomal protein L6
MPIVVPKGVKVEVRDGVFVAEGPKGKVSQSLLAGYSVNVAEAEVTVGRSGDTGPERAKHGLLRALLANAVRGVSEGFTRSLEIIGVGYRAELKGSDVHFALGYSHPIVYPVPDGIRIDIDKASKLTVSGADRQKVGQVAAEIRRLRPPDPYKGKGIKYSDEVLKKKVGKAGAK